MKSREPGNTCVAAHHSRLVSLFVLSSTLVRPFRESLVGVPWSVRPWVVCPAVTMRGQMSALLRSPVPVAVSGRCPVRASGSACAMSMIFITDTVLCCLCCSARRIRTNWKRRRSRQYQSAHIVNYNTESLAVGVGRSYGAYSVAARCRLTVGANVGRCAAHAAHSQWERTSDGGTRCPAAALRDCLPRTLYRLPSLESPRCTSNPQTSKAHTAAVRHTGHSEAPQLPAAPTPKTSL